MSESRLLRERIIIPLEILEGQTLDEDLAKLLEPIEVILLGYHVVPEQTPPSQMRNQFEDQAMKALDSIVQEIDDAGGNAESRLVFTHDAEASIERVAGETNATAQVHLNPLAPVESILAVVDPGTDPKRLARFLIALLENRQISLTLLLTGADEDDGTLEKRGEELLTLFHSLGLPTDAIANVLVAGVPVTESIVSATTSHDVTVMGSHEADWRSLFFGDIEERIAAESVGPVIEVFPASSMEY